MAALEEENVESLTPLPFSDVPSILEWEGSRCRRRRGGGAWEGIYLSPHWGRVWGGAVPPPLPRKFFIFFVENTIF